MRPVRARISCCWRRRGPPVGTAAGLARRRRSWGFPGRCNGRRAGELLGIDFEDNGAAGEVAGDLGDVGRGHAAGAAPGGPEIDEDGNFAVAKDLVELVGVTARGSAAGGRGDLQAPHLPVSERCLAGMRFGFPQEGQFWMMGMWWFRVIAEFSLVWGDWSHAMRWRETGCLTVEIQWAGMKFLIFEGWRPRDRPQPSCPLACQESRRSTFVKLL